MNKLLIKLYNLFPKSSKKKLRKIPGFIRLTSVFLKEGKSYKEVSGIIKRDYNKYKVKFTFNGSISIVSKASKRGIENTLLSNSITLIESHFSTVEGGLLGFDIGSNFGYLSLVWATSICENKGRIYAFEPNYNVYNSFKKSIVDNHLQDTIVLNNTAVGAKNGEVDIFVSVETSNVIKDAEIISETVTENRSVSMTTLDNFLDKENIGNCHFIKIDVDGIELDILRGASKVINTYKPIVIVETNNDKRIIDYFFDIDYSVLDMELNEYNSKNELPLNIFCVPKN